MAFSEQTLKVLAQSGWFVGRQIDISETNKLLKSRGFDVFPCVEQLLREFGKLEFSYFKIDGAVESFHFKPELVLGKIMEREDYSEFEYWFKEPLVVIGEAYRRNMNMFMSESGKIYGEYGGYQLFKFGENIYEALEALCLPKPIEEIKNPSLP